MGYCIRYEIPKELQISLSFLSRAILKCPSMLVIISARRQENIPAIAQPYVEA